MHISLFMLILALWSSMIFQIRLTQNLKTLGHIDSVTPLSHNTFGVIFKKITRNFFHTQVSLKIEEICHGQCRCMKLGILHQK